NVVYRDAGGERVVAMGDPAGQRQSASAADCRIGSPPRLLGLVGTLKRLQRCRDRQLARLLLSQRLLGRREPFLGLSACLLVGGFHDGQFCSSHFVRSKGGGRGACERFELLGGRGRRPRRVQGQRGF